MERAAVETGPFHLAQIATGNKKDVKCKTVSTQNKEGVRVKVRVDQLCAIKYVSVLSSRFAIW